VAVITYNIRKAVDDIESAMLVELSSVTQDYLLIKSLAVKNAIKDLIDERAIEPTGQLKGSVQRDIDEDEDGWSAIVYSDEPHAIWFEEGTGIHGPRRAYIFPRSAQFMWFKPYGMNSKVRAMRVQGQEARHVFRDGLRRVIGQGGGFRQSGEE
jgi:hypothetical protein